MTQAPRADINVTPLIDVVLVLLIIFMVFTPLLTPNYPLALPQRSADPIPPPRTPVVVALRADGTLFLAGEEVRAAGLGAALGAALGERLRATGDRRVLFDGEEACGYESVIAVLDRMRSAGAEICVPAP